MKVCPICNRKYSDNNLKFCLEDGAELRNQYTADENPTEIFPEVRSTTPPSPFDKNPNQTPPSNFQNAPNVGNNFQTPAGNSKTWLWILLILGGLVVICGGGGLFALYQFAPNSEFAKNENKNIKVENSPFSTPTYTPKIETSNTNNEINADEKSDLTKAKYELLEKGISYSEAVKIIGSKGEQVSSSESGNYKNETYKWTGDNYSFLIATFQNDKLLYKSQSKLK